MEKMSRSGYLFGGLIVFFIILVIVLINYNIIIKINNHTKLNSLKMFISITNGDNFQFKEKNYIVILPVLRCQKCEKNFIEILQNVSFKEKINIFLPNLGNTDYNFLKTTHKNNNENTEIYFAAGGIKNVALFKSGVIFIKSNKNHIDQLMQIKSINDFNVINIKKILDTL